MMHIEIRRRRIARGMTQQVLADALGLHKTAISHWESGMAAPRASMLPKLAAALGIGVSDLYTKRAA